MRVAGVVGLCVSLVGCSPASPDAAAFAADPDRARAVVEACEAGRRTGDCDAARRGLAESRRRHRMDAYARQF